jgi:hypothetical protein
VTQNVEDEEEEESSSSDDDSVYEEAAEELEAETVTKADVGVPLSTLKEAASRFPPFWRVKDQLG